MAVGDATCVTWPSHTSTNTTFFPQPPNTFLTCFSRLRGENTPEKMFASTGPRTHNHQVMSPTRSLLSHPGGAKLDGRIRQKCTLYHTIPTLNDTEKKKKKTLLEKEKMLVIFPKQILIFHSHLIFRMQMLSIWTSQMLVIFPKQIFIFHSHLIFRMQMLSIWTSP